MRTSLKVLSMLMVAAATAACGKDKPAEPAATPAPAVAEPAVPAAPAAEASPVAAPAVAPPEGASAAAADGVKAAAPGCAHGESDPTCNVAIDPKAAADHGPEVKLEGEKFGEGVTLAEATPVSKILANPDEFVGKRVRVEGEIAEVCKMAGCWFSMKGDEPGKTIKFKVQDGTMVFRQDGVGKVAIAEGMVRKMPLTMEQTLKAAEHEAQEQGKPFDPASVKAPMTLVRIEGVGAVLQDKK